MKKLTTALVVLFLATVTFAADEWHIETVDSDDDVGWHNSLALDDNDYPHIAYLNYGINDYLKYARWDGNTWHIETVDDSTSLVGYFPSLALDSSGYPHISYHDRIINLKYASWNGSSWQIEIADLAGPGIYFPEKTSLALDSFDRPHISYYDGYNHDLKYARWDGDEWIYSTVDGGVYEYVGAGSSISLDSSNNPHISYQDFGSEDLKYAYWDDPVWRVETVDSTGQTGYCSSLALDSFGYPHIAYLYYLPGFNLRYASWDGDSWHIETVDSEGDVGLNISLTLDSSDYPHISYGDWTNNSLKYAFWTGDSWYIETVDSPAYGMTSIELDSFGCPHISYYSSGSGYLKYAYREDMPGVEDVVLSAGVHNEGVLVGWAITGDAPVSFRVLRSVGEGEPLRVSGALPGSAVRWLDIDIEAGIEYRYWLEVTEADGTVSRFGPTEAVSVPEPAHELALSAYPNPASVSFTVDYTLPVDGRVTISLYDLSGRRIATVFDGEMTAGRHDISYNASALPPGVYLAHLDTDSGSLTQRLVIAR